MGCGKAEGRCQGSSSPVVSRRVALSALGALMASWLLPRRVWAKKLALRLDRLPQLRRVGASVIVRVLGKELLIVRTGEAEVRAFPAICTHQHARLAYDARRRRVVCPNHGSFFGLDGRVLKGPATKALGPLPPARLDADRKRILLDV